MIFYSLPSRLVWVLLIFFMVSCASSTSQRSTPNYSTSKQAGDNQIHVVQKGETLWRISKIYNVPVEIIKQMNRLSSNTIKAGTQLLVPSVAHIGSYATSNLRPAVRPGSFSWPTEGVIAVRYGQVQDNVRAKGVDIATKSNQAIKASRDGKVSFVSDSVKGYGKMIVIDHRDKFQTVYAYNAENLVRQGQRVRQGDMIARAGLSSRTKQPALHFEIRKNHQPVNPELFIK